MWNMSARKRFVGMGRLTQELVMDAMIQSLTIQLESLYEERAYLNEEIGISDARDVVAMVRSLEAQLNDLYARIDTKKD